MFIAYLLYPFLLWTYNKLFVKKRSNLVEPDQWPPVSLIIPAFNEKSILEKKWKNCLELDYPKEQLEIIFVTDGSTDGSELMIKEWIHARVEHSQDRKGKTAALNRVVPLSSFDLLIFNDANTFLNPSAIKQLVLRLIDSNVGAVSGEKTIKKDGTGKTTSTGEGLYWRYESWLKKQDEIFYSLIGSAGELLALKKDLFEPIPEDTILDDFACSVTILRNGKIIAYEPNAKAVEEASVSVSDEWKRKVRISAGAWQAMNRMTFLFNPFSNFKMSLLFYLHRFFRWVLAPLALIFLFFVNGQLFNDYNPLLNVIGLVQMSFFTLSILGFILRNSSKSNKLIQIPFYFCLMHLAQFAGFLRYLKGSQSAAWEKVSRT